MMVALYKTKKDAKAAVGESLKFEETSFHGPEYKDNGVFAMVGPSATKRNWFIEVTIVEGKITKVT